MNNRNKKIKVKEEVDSGYLSCVLLSYVTWTRVLVSDMEYGVQVPNSDNIGKFTTILALKKCWSVHIHARMVEIQYKVLKVKWKSLNNIVVNA